MDVLCEAGKSQLCSMGRSRGQSVSQSDKENTERGAGLTEKLSGPGLKSVRDVVTVQDSQQWE